MKKIILFLLTFNFTNNALSQNGQIVSEGVIYYKKENVFVLPDSITVLNTDKTTYSKILKYNNILNVIYTVKPNDSKSNITLQKAYPYYYIENSKYNAPIPDLIIRAYYPDYGVFVVDANKISNNEYEIFINGEWKKISGNYNQNYKEWVDFIKDLLIQLPDNINLYSKNSIKSKKIRTPKNLSYKVLEVKGNWIKIECNNNCEDCNKKQKTKGWVKWKKGNEILVSLLYVC
jgi:hypothetical protein